MHGKTMQRNKNYETKLIKTCLRPTNFIPLAKTKDKARNLFFSS